MTGLHPVSPINRRALAVWAVFCLALARLAAQPLNPSATDDATPTNLVEPMLVRAAGANAPEPTKAEHNHYTLAMARYRTNTREYPEAETNYISLLAEDKPETLR